MARLETRMCGQYGAASGHVVGAIQLEQNDEWAVSTRSLHDPGNHCAHAR